MADGVTYAGALAACVGRWGDAADLYAVSACARAWWSRAWDGESDDEDGVMLAETHLGGVELVAMAGPAAVGRWTLAHGHEVDHDDANPPPVTPLPDALDAADRWLRERAP